MTYSFIKNITHFHLLLWVAMSFCQQVFSQVFIDRFATTELVASSTSRPTVYSIDRASDGRLIIGGDFSSRINGNTISVGLARIDGLGKVDPGFAPMINAGYANKVITLENGKILVAGQFSTVNSTTTGAVVRLNADGTLDTSFAVHPTNLAYDMARQSNGKIIVAGVYPAVAGFTSSVTNLYRLNTDGSLDQTFQQGVAGASDDAITALAVLSNDEIIVAGRFTLIGGSARSRIAKLSSVGRVDADSFTGASADNNIEALQIQPDGKVIIGGAFQNVLGVGRKRIARLEADGTLDTSFVSNNSIDSYVSSLALAPNGMIYVGGDFSTLGGSIPNSNFGRLKNDGSVDTSFNVSANGVIWAIKPYANGFIDVGGAASNIGNQQSVGLNRFDSKGAPDANFTSQSGTDAVINSIAVIPDQDTIWLGGDFTQIGSKSVKWLSRQNQNGAHLSGYQFSAFNAVGSGIDSVAATLDGSVIAVGNFTGIGSRIAKVNTSGAIDANFSASVDGPLYAVTTQPDGKILVGGVFGSANNTARSRIARLNADGTLDQTFNPASILNGTVRGILVQDDGKIVAAGRLFLGTRRAAVIRFNSDGSEDMSFNSGGVTAGSDVYSIARQADGKYLIGGDFTDVNNTPANRMARLNDDGTIDSSFTAPSFAGSVPSVRSISVRSDNSIVIGGSFPNATFTNLAILKSDGSVDTHYAFSSATAGAVLAIAEEFNGKTVIGGDFTATSGANGTGRDRLARFATSYSSESLHLALNETGDSLTLAQGGFSPVFNWAFAESSLDGSNWTLVSTARRKGAGLVFDNIEIEELESKFFRISANAGGTPSSGSLYRSVFTIFRNEDPQDGCDFFIIRVNANSNATVCL